VSIDVDGHSIRFIDTPGLSFVVAPDATSEEAEGTRAADILLRSKGRIDRLKDPVAPCAYCPLLSLGMPMSELSLPVTQIVSRANAEDLMLFYNLPAFTAGDADAFLRTLARIERLTKKVAISSPEG
jgi:nuclear GTP-binding protein